MTELQREQVLEGMFPDWQEHLNDSKVIDQILDGLSCHGIVLNRCSRPGCNNVARSTFKRCARCAARSAEYMRTYERRRMTSQQTPETQGQPEGTSNLQAT